MKKSILLQLNVLTLVLFTFFVSSVASAQQGKPVASPRDSVSGKIGNAMVTINYGSPSVKSRKIWGGLESYGKVWRAGANEATTFTTDKAVTVEGKPLPAGSYAFFVIPQEDGQAWTVIFNKTAKQWGAYKYDAAQDALRVSVKPKKAKDVQEQLKYVITSKGFELRWEHIQLPVSVK